jgi:hypothetical protein
MGGKMKPAFSLILIVLLAGTTYGQETSDSTVSNRSKKIDVPSARPRDAVDTNTEPDGYVICLTDPPILCRRDVQPFTQAKHVERVADKKFWFLAAASVSSFVALVEATRSYRATVGRGECIGHYGSPIAIQGLTPASQSERLVSAISGSNLIKKLERAI